MTRLLRMLKNLPASLWIFWAFLMGLLFLFALMAEEVLERDPIVFDQAILEALNRWQTPGLDRIAGFLDVVGGSHILVPATLLASVLLWRIRPRSAVFFGLAVLGAMALNGLAKLYFERARPDGFAALVPAEGFAFPSGHTMGSTAVAVAAYLVVRTHAPSWRWPALVLGAGFATAVGVSRSYLQVHYPSDVLAGWALSTAWVLGVYAWYAAAQPRATADGATPRAVDRREPDPPDRRSSG